MMFIMNSDPLCCLEYHTKSFMHIYIIHTFIIYLLIKKSIINVRRLLMLVSYNKPEAAINIYDTKGNVQTNINNCSKYIFIYSASNYLNN